MGRSLDNGWITKNHNIYISNTSLFPSLHNHSFATPIMLMYYKKTFQFTSNFVISNRRTLKPQRFQLSFYSYIICADLTLPIMLSQQDFCCVQLHHITEVGFLIVDITIIDMCFWNRSSELFFNCGKLVFSLSQLVLINTVFICNSTQKHFITFECITRHHFLS